MARHKTDAALIALTQAVRRLQPEQGQVARRNARRAVGAAVRVLRQRIEEEFPSLVKPKASKPRTQQQRIDTLLKKGYVDVEPSRVTKLIAAMAEVGVRPVTVRSVGKLGHVMSSVTYVPGWCVEVGADVAKLRKAKKSQTDRAALQAESALLALGNRAP